MVILCARFIRKTKLHAEKKIHKHGTIFKPFCTVIDMDDYFHIIRTERRMWIVVTLGTTLYH